MKIKYIVPVLVTLVLIIFLVGSIEVEAKHKSKKAKNAKKEIKKKYNDINNEYKITKKEKKSKKSSSKKNSKKSRSSESTATTGNTVANINQQTSSSTGTESVNEISGERIRLLAFTDEEISRAESEGCTLAKDGIKAKSLSCPKEVASSLGLEEDIILHALDVDANKLIGANIVHLSGNTGTGRKVVVLDTGIDYNHPELRSSYLGGKDFVNNDSDPIDDHGHGTAVTGAITADGIDSRVRGVAPDTGIIVGKIANSSGFATIGNIINGIYWSVNGPDNIYGTSDDFNADAISISFGTQRGVADFCDETSPGTTNAIKYARDRGTAVVIAAGNRGTSGVSLPGCISYSTTVGAVFRNDTISPFSGIGISVDITAPGVLIYTTRYNDSYRETSGTSIATPHVTATVALIKKLHPEYNIDQVEEALFKTAKDLGELGKDTSYGWGRVNAYASVFSNTNTFPFFINNKGGFSLTTLGSSGTTTAGYARIQPNSGSTTPAGVAIFGLKQNNVLVSEAGVPASPLIRTGRIYAETNQQVSTGIAIANPNNQDATISFYFTDSDGNNFNEGNFVLSANQQIAKFLHEAPFNAPLSMSGTFTFSSDSPISVIALRGLNNERGEFLMTTLPVAELITSTSNILFPHFADGNGWFTQLVLINPTDETLSGNIQFFSQGSSSTPGQPITLTVNDQTSNTFSYVIPSRTSRSFKTSGTGTNTQSGSIRVVVSANSKAPTGLGIFSYKPSGVTVSEAGVPAVDTTTAFRLYVENFESRSIYTGIAIANPSANAITVNFELNRLDGSSSGLTGSASVPANGQIALFLNQINGFQSLPSSFQGVLRISTSSSLGISVIGLRSRNNERNDFLITTIPVANENTAASSSEMLFPHLADGGGYTTKFILFSGSAGQSSNGNLRTFAQNSNELSSFVK